MDKALSSVLGRTTIDTFYYAIQEHYGLPRNKFSEKPLEVNEHLKKILGEVGFRVLERSIVNEIKETFEVREVVRDIATAINLAKQNYLRESLR